jgi:hypothetical protein
MVLKEHLTKIVLCDLLINKLWGKNFQISECPLGVYVEARSMAGNYRRFTGVYSEADEGGGDKCAYVARWGKIRRKFVWRELLTSGSPSRHSNHYYIKGTLSLD